MGNMWWVAANWFELLQTAGIIASLLFSAYSMRRDEQGRRIGNLTAIKQDYIQIWNQLYTSPELARVLDKNADLGRNPVSTAEWLFVKMLIVHLDSVHRAMRTGLFVTLDGLEKDMRDFFASPIPKVVWRELRPFQDQQFVRFVEGIIR